jgi:hypothetical protein
MGLAVAVGGRGVVVDVGHGVPDGEVVGDDELGMVDGVMLLEALHAPRSIVRRMIMGTADAARQGRM